MKVRKKTGFCTYFSLGLLLGSVTLATMPSEARAAREAVIREMTAEVYEGPDEETAVLETRKEGEVVKVSDKDKDGWHKVKLKRPREGFTIGWIHKDVLDFKGSGKSKSSKRRSSYNPEDKTFSGMIVYDVPVSSVALEFGVNLDTDWRLSARVGATEYTETASGSSATYEAKGRDLFLLAEYMIHHGSRYRLGLAAGLGMSSGTTLKDKTTAGSPTSATFSAMGGIGKGTIRYFLGSSFALHGEVGFRYLTKSNVVVGNNIVNLTLNSLVGAVGLAMEF